MQVWEVLHVIDESSVVHRSIQASITGVLSKKSKESILYLACKRVIDILGAILGLILLFIIYPIVGILVKLDSRGPIIFTQERVGKNGKIFRVYKFRTMVHNAEELIDQLDGFRDSRKYFIQRDNDPRVTKVGYFLRKYSIDELPQVLNILKGEMSLVGPRPFIIDETLQLSPQYLVRLTVKPGLTGYAQVHGRNNLNLQERMEYDLKYINHRSLLLDFIILFKTVLVVLKKEGVY
jgi:lipopolysaccharide/colanic/teichoic acid biosynthesis glycosyltransferase